MSRATYQRQAAPAGQDAVEAYRRGDLETASQLCRQALKRNKNDAQSLHLLGRIAERSGDAAGATQYMSRCVKAQPRNIQPRIMLGQILASRALYDRALDELSAALRIDPNAVDALVATAMVYERQSRYDDARAFLEPHVKDARTDPGIAAVYLRILARDGEHETVVRLGTAVADEGNHREDLWFRDVLFAVAKSHEMLGRYAEALEAGARANAIHAAPFDPDALHRWVDAVIATFTAERMAELPRAGGQTDLPVFIVGMPRTGSTLVERIIHCHPDAFGAGELLTLPRLVESLPRRIGLPVPYPRAVESLSPNEIAKLSSEYRKTLKKTDPRAKRIADKYLSNYQFLGLIEMILPGARVIDVRRNPLDTCLSCYLERLTPESAPYATNLQHLGAAYRAYERLMDHWHSVLSIPILRIAYEDLVGDQEASTRTLLEFCDLPWDDACIDFWKTRRHDNTLSFDQVRRPLYDSSMGRAARFGDLLAPLRDALAG